MNSQKEGTTLLITGSNLAFIFQSLTINTGQQFGKEKMWVGQVLLLLVDDLVEEERKIGLMEGRKKVGLIEKRRKIG